LVPDLQGWLVFAFVRVGRVAGTLGNGQAGDAGGFGSTILIADFI
jgi:hypothetical protein